MTIGERIRKRRLELNLTQDELAKRVGYASRSSINKLEMARVLPSRKIMLMAQALDCTPAYLMGWEDKQVDIASEFEKYFQDSEQASRLIAYLDAFAKLSKESQDNVIDYMNYQAKKETDNESN